ncbi:MAG: endo-1,4-beta-xylanase [Clostridiales bacterium]|jgi:endo-1,4-beta-xylanase|nr:endo-1,4-beta-xylanase [Clostridiales bacterium]
MSDFFESLDFGMVTSVVYKIISLFMPVALFLSGTSAAELDYSDKLGDSGYTGLYEVYEDYFPIGSAVSSGLLKDSQCSEFVLKNFSSMTFEYELKQPIICPTEGGWNFKGADAVADFAREHGLKLRGHTLLWGEESPQNWMVYDENKNLVDKETFYARLYDYFSVIIPRYDDVVDDWDIINEACHWDYSSRLHKDALYKICGEEYIYKAFEFAKEFVGENDKLILNETKVLNNKAKENNLYATIKAMIEKGTPIDGVGIQCHVDTLSFKETARRLDSIIKRFSKLGIEIQITELDMTAYSYDAQKAYDELPVWVEQLQILKYKRFFEVLRSHSDVVTSVTFWGIDDEHSYLAKKDGREDWGLLFDKHGNPKQSFYAACDF